MKSISITQDERKLIYAVLNNEQKNSHFKYEKLKKFLSFFNKNRNDKGKDCTTSHDFVGLIDKGLIELER